MTIISESLTDLPVEKSDGSQPALDKDDVLQNSIFFDIHDRLKTSSSSAKVTDNHQELIDFSKHDKPRLFSSQELELMNEEQLLDVLRESWGCQGKKLEVWGRLSVSEDADKIFYKLTEVRSVQNNEYLSYPCNVMRELANGGIYIIPKHGRELRETGHQFFRCELKLSPKTERIKHNNLLEVTVKPNSASPLHEIPSSADEHVLLFDDKTLISDFIYKHYLSLKKEQSQQDEEKLRKQLEANISDVQDTLTQLQQEYEQIKVQIAGRQQESVAIQEHITVLKDQQHKEQHHLDTIRNNQAETEIQMSRYIEKLKYYIDEKATILKQLEFIDADEYDELFLKQPVVKESTERLSFVEALDRNYSKAVSYIQAYLLQQDILYPRHILENFFTLLRTNDLIILAGDSGSGKTNLVQSFAKAIGGISKIIPVKPNWTSSEDLLGYYNPLEKKYLATPFLEALIEAKNNPEVPYLICLDEMNLARVEYYFADFLSKLEQRGDAPVIELFSDTESAHVLSELKHVIEIIRGAKDKYQKGDVVDFVKLMQDEEINTELKRVFGFSDKDSLIKYHADIRRMLSGAINTPSSIHFPANVRIIGAINIDDTTHYLSPKILDRAHVMKFKSPLLMDWQKIIKEADNYGFKDVNKALQFDIADLGSRTPYPKFDLDHPFCQRFVTLNKEYFHPMGVEFGMRAIRQGLNYITIFSEFNDNEELAVNNFVLHKVLPKLTFDGNKETTNNITKLDLLYGLAVNLENELDPGFDLEDDFSAKIAVSSIANKAKANDGIVNYWS